MKLIKHEKVKSDMTDFSANLSVIGFFQIAEESVTELMGELKIDGITAKEKYDAIWVFTKSKLKVYKNIAWNERYTSIGYISKITPVTIYIDIEIRNEASELCGCLRVELCALDLQSGKIRKVSTVGINNGIQIENPKADISFSRFSTESLSEVGQVKVKYANIDYAGHTNNKEYIRFLLNTYSTRELEERPIIEMEIIYISQAFEHDILTVWKKCGGDKDILAIQRDGSFIVKSEIIRANARKARENYENRCD